MSRLRRVGMGLLAATMFLSSATVMAKEGNENINVSFNNTKVYLENTQIATSAEPFMYDGKNYIVVEDVAKALGYTVVKDASGQVINFKKSTTTEVGMTKEVESNDAYSIANVLKLNATLTGTLGYKDDNNKSDEYDWYKINVSEPSNLAVEVAAGVDLGISVYIYAQDGSDTIKFTSGKNKKLNIDAALEGGEYYIRIGRTNYKSGEYTLKTTLVAQTVNNDSLENGSYQNAQDYSLGQTTTGLLGFYDQAGNVDEYDWYTMVIDKDREVSLTVSGSKGLGLNLYIYADDASKTMAFSSGKDKKVAVSKKLTKGTYYVRVGRTNYQDGKYTLTSK